MLQRLTAPFRRPPTTAEDWLARLERPHVSSRDQAAFLAWLEADDEHLRQYEEAKAAREALEPLRGMFASDIAAVGRPIRRTPRRLVLAGGALAVCAAVALALPFLHEEGRLYEGAARQVTDVTLDDGTHVTLDAGAAIHVVMERDGRRVTLDRGAAYFDVSHDAERPFQVAVADRRVVVTGTRFVTARVPGGGVVSLLEGAVTLAGPGGSTRLAPGERAAFRKGETEVRRQRADLEAATAWRKRRLVFRDVPLSQVIAVAGRYTDRRLVIADPALARTRVTAVLPLEGDGDLVERIDRLLPITVDRRADGETVIRRE